MPWADLDLPHAELTGKNTTDDVTRVPGEAQAQPDPIPAAVSMLREAKSTVVAYLMERAPTVAAEFDGPKQLLTEALANPELEEYVLQLLSYAWLIHWNSSQYAEVGDRFHTQMLDAQDSLTRNTKAFSDLARQMLGQADRPSEAPHVVGRVSDYTTGQRHNY